MELSVADRRFCYSSASSFHAVGRKVIGCYRNEETDVWGPAEIRVLSDALEEACRRAQTAGILVDEIGESARDAMASRIIAMAKRGENMRYSSGSIRHFFCEN